MKLLAVRLARAIWIIPPYFINPMGKFMCPAIEAMKIRYSFLKTPLDGPLHPPPTEGTKFETGAFNGKNGVVQIISLTFHNDGLVVDTRSSTEDANAFLEDVINWGSQEYGLPSLADLPIRKVYTSELNVAFSRTPAIFNPKLAPFLDAVSAAIADQNTGAADMLSIQLSTDPTRTNRQAFFRIDREVSVPFEENRYYSFAQTTTDIHRQLLENLERLSI